MPRFLALFLLFLSLTLPTQAQEKPKIAVVELFTTAGCSNCPPADKILQKVVDNYDGEVIALACHVTAFDKPDFRDNLSLKDCDDRQRAYRRHKVVKYTFMPQMIFNGVHDTKGNRENIVWSGVKMAESLATIVPVNITLENGNLTVTLPTIDLERDVDVWLFGYDRLHSQDLPYGGGEDGKQPATVEYVNAVRHVRKLMPWGGHATTMAVPPDMFQPANHYAVIVQEQQSMKILAAGKTD